MQGAFTRPTVGDQFVKFFQSILGTKSGVKEIKNPANLFVHKISNELANHMVRHVTDEEIKEAMFDIGNDKGPGPDGFSAKIFKAAWNVVGPEVCKAIKDFFGNGCMLRELNVTIISLVLKTSTPRRVADFRPMACCNVIYKCISKILTDKIKIGLDGIVNEYRVLSSLAGKLVITSFCRKNS